MMIALYVFNIVAFTLFAFIYALTDHRSKGGFHGRAFPAMMAALLALDEGLKLMEAVQ